MAMAHKYK